MTHLNNSTTPCCCPNGSLAFSEKKSDVLLYYDNQFANMQLELTYLYTMEHFFYFFYSQAPNSAGVNAFCNLTSSERSLETGHRLSKCHSSRMKYVMI